jgi:hypothetical protein
MKKLLVTTALAGLVFTGSANAQTTITGELRINYGAAAADQATANLKSQRGFGAEQQLNVQTKGKLNIGGIDYAAGFAIENDGEQSTTLFNENTYMDFIIGNTTLSLSRDHIQRSDTDRSFGVLLGYSPNDLNSQSGFSASGNTTRFQQSPGPQVGQNFSAAILQKTPIGTFSAAYTPTATENSGTRTTASTQSSSNASERTGEGNVTAESAYEIGFTGDLGVKGLDVYAFRGQEKQRAAYATQAFVNNYGIKYTMGEITAGYTQKKYADASTGTSTENKEHHYGLGYAVSKDMTVALLVADAKGNGDATKEKAKSIQLGYNLGPVGMVAGYGISDNIAGVATQDSKEVFVRFIGAF